MPEDQLRQAAQSYSTLILIVGIGLLGIVVMLGLFFVWRRSQRRMRELERERDRARREAAPHVDTWRTSAERMRTDEGPPRPPLIRPPDDAPPPGDDAPPDEPWRQSLGDLPYFQEERRREQEEEMEDEDDDEDDDFDDSDDDDRKPER